MRPYPRAVAVTLVTAATFVDLVAYSVAVPVLPDLAARLGATPTTIGFLFASFGLTLVAVSVPMGVISDRIGRKGPMVAGDVYVHHFIRATFRSRPPGGRQWNRLKELREVYPPEDLAYSRRPRISAVVTADNSVGQLDRVAHYLEDQTRRDCEMLIVGKSPMPEKAWLLSRYSPHFRHPTQIVATPEGATPDLAVSRAVAVARGKYLLFLDGGSAFPRGFLRKHLAERRPGLLLTDHES